MKSFAAACLLSTALAFDIALIKPLVVGDYSIETRAAPKKRMAGIPQFEAMPKIPLVSEAEGHDEIVQELIDAQKACAADAVAECSIDIKEEDGASAAHGLNGLLTSVTAGFDSLLDSNEAVESEAIATINANTNKQIDAQIAEANTDAKAQLIHDITEGKINVTKLNNIHESKADAIKEVSEDNSHVVADVAKQATVVEIMNKATKGSLVNDLAKAAEEGESTMDVIAKADPPVNLDVGELFGNFGDHSGFGQ